MNTVEREQERSDSSTRLTAERIDRVRDRFDRMDTAQRRDRYRKLFDLEGDIHAAVALADALDTVTAVEGGEPNTVSFLSGELYDRLKRVREAYLAILGE